MDVHRLYRVVSGEWESSTCGKEGIHGLNPVNPCYPETQVQGDKSLGVLLRVETDPVPEVSGVVRTPGI